MKGIDLSQWNTVKDYEAIKASGYDFAIIRAVGSKNGKRYHDTRFELHYDGCKAAEMHLGAYAYFQPHLSGYNYLDDALYFLDTFRADMEFDMPIYLDVEAWCNMSSYKNIMQKSKIKKMQTDYVIGFCDTIEKRGFYSGIYGSDISTFKDMINIDDVGHFTWWVARYGNKPKYANNEKNLGIWQTTSKGSIKGIVGNVDVDECYKNFPDVIKKYHLNVRR